MRRNHVILVGLVALICGWVFFVLIAKPALVLPTVTIPLPANNSPRANQPPPNAAAVDVVLRTDGKIAARAEGQQVADLSYNLVSLSNVANLAEQSLMPRPVMTVVRLIPFVFPQLGWNAVLGGLSMYYVLPVETTVRFVYR